MWKASALVGAVQGSPTLDQRSRNFDRFLEEPVTLDLPTPLVATDWLARHLDDPALRIFDATVHLAAPAQAGEEWTPDLLRRSTGCPHSRCGLRRHHRRAFRARRRLRSPNPPPERFAAAAGRLGIGPETAVVVYAADVFWATRLWWLLLANGFDNVAVLDGGIGKWTAEGRPTRSGDESYPPANFVGTPRPELFAELARSSRSSSRAAGPA